MKSYLLLILVIIIGGALIFVPPMIKGQKNTQQDNFSKKLEENTSETNVIEIVSEEVEKENYQSIEDENIIIMESSLETIQSEDEIQLESEPYNTNQIYVENIELLYDYFSFFEVDYIKEQITNYLKSMNEKNILDCSIEKNSFETFKENSFSFVLLYDEQRREVFIEKKEKNLGITITEIDEEKGKE